MRHLKQLGNRVSIPIPRDEDGYLGRECPDCERYFKITPGTGLAGENLPCHCPYCGHSAQQDQFFTKAQIEFAKSVAINKVTGAFIKDLKRLEFNHRPRGPFGIGISMKVEGRPKPIRRYSELQLEEEVTCDNCTLKYTIYGIFAFCPDCGLHNSLQILEKNLSLASKQIDLASNTDTELATHLIADALENGVSAFDGFGRETCRVHAAKSTNPKVAATLSFQNLAGAKSKIQQLFGINLTDALSGDEWAFVCRCFQKRHLLAHTMGIVDDAYLKSTSDPHAAVGRKVVIGAEEVKRMVAAIRAMGMYMVTELKQSPTGESD